MSFSRIIIIALTLISKTVFFAQGDSCVNSTFFCSDSSYTYTSLDSTTAEVGPNYGCLSTQPNINWLHFQISQPGDLELTISSSLGYDLDFICWGPFSDISTACYPTNTGVDCSYSTAASEICTIPGAQIGEYYLLAITNYSGLVSDITIDRTGGTAYAACAGVNACQGAFSNVTISSCDTIGDTHIVFGNLLTFNPPPTGDLFISNSLGDTIVAVSAPFSDTIPFMYVANSDGGAVSIMSSFTDSLQCSSYYNYNAPTSCLCNIASYNIVASSGDSCFLFCGGSASVLVNGGTPPYSYQWSDAQISDTAINLCDGLYSVVVTDSNGCTRDTQVAILQSSINYVISNTQTILQGDSVEICVDDISNVIISYSWNTGDTTSCISVSPADTTMYNVSIEFCNSTANDSVIVMVDQGVVINENHLEKNIIITPNPAKNLVKITGLKRATDYQIFDINGKVMQKGKTNENISFDLPKGVYIIKFKGYKLKKLVVRM